MVASGRVGTQSVGMLEVLDSDSVCYGLVDCLQDIGIRFVSRSRVCPLCSPRSRTAFLLYRCTYPLTDVTARYRESTIHPQILPWSRTTVEHTTRVSLGLHLGTPDIHIECQIPPRSNHPVPIARTARATVEQQHTSLGQGQHVNTMTNVARGDIHASLAIVDGALGEPAVRNIVDDGVDTARIEIIAGGRFSDGLLFLVLVVRLRCIEQVCWIAWA